MAGVMTPYAPHYGAEGAVSGLLAVSCVELEQSWTLLTDPCLRLFEIFMVFALLIIMGTLPHVEIFCILTGFAFGLVVGIIFMPYLTFGHWKLKHRRILMAVSIPIFIVMTFGVFYFFYDKQHVREACGSACQNIDCVPYTTDICSLTELPPY